jgi:division protein CdvB (Snf7/Vps24/ESCRT-III family)
LYYSYAKLFLLLWALYFCWEFLQSSQRDIEREMRELDRQEKQITLELKQRAKAVNSSNDPTLKALAKQLVQVRQQRNKLQSTKAQIGAMGMHATVTASQIAAATAIGTVTETMKVANSAMDVKKTTKIMTDFQRENERMNLKQEMMDDALIDAFDTEGVDEEADQITSQVLAELGVELDGKMVGLNAPQTKLQPAAENELSKEEQDAMDDILPDLKARLNAL